MSEEIIQNLIPIDVPKGDFERFLGQNGKNKRIFFSGKYGAGKTYFLKKFFEHNSEMYDVYHLFPVRYQIANSENIIDLLKYDILVELLKNHSEVFKQNEAKGVDGMFKLFIAFTKDRGLLSRFIKGTVRNGESLLALSPDPLMQTLSKLGRSLNDLLEIDEEFQNFKKRYLEGEKGVIEKYLETIQVEHDPVATDYISHLIREKIRESKGEKRSVLILDDFDRIDPEHIFRILNILSSHVDDNEENKFGFDHIIIVGDRKNLKSIFHHRYGISTEFSGYFDKFFSVRPYEFNNNAAIKERIPQLLKKVQCEEVSLKEALGNSGIISTFMERMLTFAFDTGKMNVRQLFKPINNQFSELGAGVYNGNDPFIDTRNQLLDISVKLFMAVCGGQEDALDTLRSIRKYKITSKGQEREPDWFYKEYSCSMLRYMVSIKPDESMQWLGKYVIKASQNQSSSRMVNIYPAEGGIDLRGYFFDTLIEYIEQNRYNKTRRDYID